MSERRGSTPAGTGDPRRSFAAVRRTAAYRAVVEAWREPAMLACSGGVDSVGLLVTAAAARAAGRVGPTVVAHVDHGTRPETAAEGRFVAGQAARFGLPFTSLRIDRPQEHSGGGAEAILREARYASFARAGAALGIATVVTAHTLDDQIETVLLRLLSGASPIAAAGMRRETLMTTGAGTINILRPLLSIRRIELLDLLEIASTPFVDDPSNRDARFRRNRVRHELLPLLRELEPGFDATLLRSVELARRDAEVVDRLARDAFDRMVTMSDRTAEIDRAALLQEPLAIAGRVLKMAVEDLAGEDTREFTFERFSAVIGAAGGRTGAVIELPGGIYAIIERRLVRIEKRKA